MNIYLIRHTSVAVRRGLCYGQTDVPLSFTFEDEAKIVKERLKDIRPNIVFTSPLSRCTRLAKFCNFEDAIPDNRLKELNFGDWEGQKWNRIDLSVWERDWINPPAPNGESFMEMYKRVTSFFSQLSRETHHTALIFTHAGVINCARIYFRQVTLNNAFASTPQYGEMVEFRSTR